MKSAADEGFAPEARAGFLLRREKAVEYLERDRRLSLHVLGAIHGSHRASTEGAGDAVALVDDGADREAIVAGAGCPIHAPPMIRGHRRRT